MHILLVEPGYYSQYPPLGLLKLSAWHREKGDTVQFVRGTKPLMNVWKEPDTVYISSLFSWAWRPVHDAVLTCKAIFPQSEIWLGGIYASLLPDHARRLGVNVQTGILSHLENLLPDYSIVPNWHLKKKASIFFTHRGCIRKCHFCAVPALEGKPRQFRPTTAVRHLIHPDHDKAILWDNNILGESHWEDVFDELSDIKVEVDFNQGLDVRLITEKVAQKLQRIKMPFVRIAYDSPKTRKAVKRGIANLQAAGIRGRSIFSYVLYNFHDTPKELFTRVRDLLDWGVVAYPMRFEPLDTLEKGIYISPNWSKEELELVANTRRVIGYGGAFPPYEGLQKKFRNASCFEEAFGLWNSKEDVKLRNRPLRKERILFDELGEDHQLPVARVLR